MKVLVVVDMQNDFIDGALGSPEAQAIVPNVVKKILKCAADPEYAIFYTRDTHFDNYLDTNEGKHLPFPHCIANTYGWQINEEVMLASTGAKCVDVQNKYTFGMADIAAMIDSIPELCQDYDKWEVESIEIVGLCTDICVVSNALILKSVYDDIPITVYKSCCAGVTPAKHEAALEVMRSCQIEVV